MRNSRETLIKFSFSTASRDTVAPDETGDPGDDDRIRAVHKENAAGCFLEEMGQVVPWGELCALIEPHYPKAGGGRPPVGVERMLRIYFLQQWFNLSDRG